MNIPNIQQPVPSAPLDRTVKKETTPKVDGEGLSFNETLDSLSNSQTYSDNLIQQLAGGEDVDIHQVMIAAEQTDVNFRVALAIRDRLVDAYKEVMRMNV